MKRMTALLAVLLLAISAVLPVYAANGNVTYNGEAKKFIFAPGSQYSPSDLFPDFKDVMPGDTLTQKITVRNDASNDVKVMIYVRSLGAHEESAEFLSRLKLRVRKSEDNEMAYMFDAAADQAAQLSDWVCLGMLYSGGEVNLDVILDVPVELENEFQDQIGYLDWEFKIEEYPVEGDDPAPPTGDMNVVFWAILTVCSVGLMIIVLLWRKKAQKITGAQH